MNSINFWRDFKDDDFVISLPNKYKCAKCNIVMMEPYLLACSHDFCIDCKNQVFFQDIKICFICNEEVDLFMLDKKLIKELKEIEILCLNSKECIWKGDISSFQNHYYECYFRLVSCDLNCGLSFPKKELVSHKLNSCKERDIKCEYCHT